ncbi:hypothetical protein BDB01DRAFT_792283 [Pilobolus umbonatus]|nr:hypothetical protein BDB01DRAFT_792283 [Pilobolus umbonatus]
MSEDIETYLWAEELRKQWINITNEKKGLLKEMFDSNIDWFRSHSTAKDLLSARISRKDRKTEHMDVDKINMDEQTKSIVQTDIPIQEPVESAEFTVTYTQHNSTDTTTLIEQHNIEEPMANGIENDTRDMLDLKSVPDNDDHGRDERISEKNVEDEDGRISENDVKDDVERTSDKVNDNTCLEGNGTPATDEITLNNHEQTSIVDTVNSKEVTPIEPSDDTEHHISPVKSPETDKVVNKPRENKWKKSVDEDEDEVQLVVTKRRYEKEMRLVEQSVENKPFVVEEKSPIKLPSPVPHTIFQLSKPSPMKKSITTSTDNIKPHKSLNTSSDIFAVPKSLQPLKNSIAKTKPLESTGNSQRDISKTKENNFKRPKTVSTTQTKVSLY